ncbi:MAG TPA: helix-turn-helix transcriptional regulator [Burkholderiales bacterium]|nr:helix-turn-helix transcriptional regulator [Burkholderiales bacterium]
MADDYPAGHATVRHAHRRSQLFHGTTGMLRVITRDGAWIAPPHRAVWVPGSIEHQVVCRGAVAFRTLYVEPDASPRLPAVCCVIEMSDLLRALIHQAVVLPIDYDPAGRDGRVMALILDELGSAPRSPVHVPMPAARPLRRLCEDFLGDPASRAGLDAWAARAAMSRRTLTRRFRAETGMTIAGWRQQARLIEALSLMAEGMPVTAAAFEVGYDSASAFSAAFRRTFGCSPTQY